MLDLTKRHPYYAERRPAWLMAQHHYEGGRALVKENAAGDQSAYLTRFWVEVDDDYRARLARAMRLYDNLPKKALHVYQSQLYRIKPQRKLPASVAEAEKNIDLLGTNADDFFDRVTKLAKLYGVFGVLIDSPSKAALTDPTTGSQVSEANAQERVLRPWAEAISPLSIIDWEWERDDPRPRGQLNWVVIHDVITRGRKPFSTGDESMDRFRVYTPTQIKVFELEQGRKRMRDEEPVSITDHNLGEVPLVLFYADFEEPMKSATIFDDVVLSACALWNTWSVLDEGFYSQGFEILTLRTDEAVSEIKLGEKAGMKLPKDGSLEYTAPSGVPAEMGMKRVQAIVERVADLVFNRTARAQLPSAAPESGEKREQDRREFIALLERYAGQAEAGERKVWEVMARIASGGATDGAVEVTYNRTFQVDDRAPEEWIAEVEEGISSKAEWYMALHPAVTDEDKAWEKIKENLAKNREVGGAAQDRAKLQETLKAQLGEGNEDEEEEESPPAEDAEETPETETPPEGEEEKAA